MKLLTPWIATLCVAALATPTALADTTAADAEAPAPLPAGVVAKVGNVTIREADVVSRLWAEQGASFVDRLINQEIIKQEAAKRNLSATDEEVTTQMQEYQTRFMQAPGRQPIDWVNFQKRYGQANLREDALIQVLVRKISDAEAITITLDDEEKARIKEDLERQSVRVSAKHILVGIGPQFNNRTRDEAEARIKEVQTKLAAGEDWDALASEYSDDVVNKDRGGDLGFFTRDQMVGAFEEAAFSLQPGQRTPQPVETEYGFHLIQVVERSEDPVTPEEIAAENEQTLARKKQIQSSIDAWFPPLMEQYEVQVTMPYERD